MRVKMGLSVFHRKGLYRQTGHRCRQPERRRAQEQSVTEFACRQLGCHVGCGTRLYSRSLYRSTCECYMHAVPLHSEQSQHCAGASQATNSACSAVPPQQYQMDDPGWYFQSSAHNRQSSNCCQPHYYYDIQHVHWCLENSCC